MKLKARKRKHCFALLIMVIVVISVAMMSMPVAALDGDVTFDLTAYYHATYGIIPGVTAGGYVIVDVYVDASALNLVTGMHGYGLKVNVAPAVLTPVAAEGGSAGYFLYDWFFATYPPGPGFPPTFIWSVGPDYIECTEFFLPLPPDGATGVGKLCTLYFQSNSLTDYTELTIDAANSGYQDATGAQYLINPVDGHYNMPPWGHLFEIPTGGTFPTGDPTGSDWHELEPAYCTPWTLNGWVDGGDGKFSPSDYIAMMRSGAIESVWFHVEWISPFPAAGDDVADMLVTALSPRIPPSASFTFSPSEPIVGGTVTFDASASNDPDGTIISYAWDFGDGTNGSGVIVEHEYATAGDYNVTLTVTDIVGLTDTTTAIIPVSPIVPEFPFGAEAAVGMGFMIVVAYVWLRNRRKTKPTVAKRFTTQTSMRVPKIQNSSYCNS